MTRANANAHMDDARADLVNALADLDTGDKFYNMVEDIIERLDYIINYTAGV